MHKIGTYALRTLMPLCALLWATPQSAQDGVANTPPELKDFRLDPENKPPEVKPTLPDSVPDVLPDALVVSKEPIREAASEQAAPEKVAKAATKTIPEKNAPAKTVSAEPARESVAKEPAIAPALSPTPDPMPPVQPIGSETKARLSRVPWFLIGIAALVMSIAGLALFLYRRRKTAPDRRDRATTPTLTSPPKIVAPLPKTHNSPERNAAKRPKPAARPILNIRFIPSKATVSFSTLTIKGALQIINEGTAPAKSMRLRVAIISASENQNAVITAFHDNPDQGTINQLGPAAADERVAMQIELTIPLTEVKTYPLGDQQLFVPIILANVEYAWLGKEAQDQARISCMVGREANPPQPKMGPFRLDLGPRSFASLGQRLLFT